MGDQTVISTSTRLVASMDKHSHTNAGTTTANRAVDESTRDTQKGSGHHILAINRLSRRIYNHTPRPKTKKARQSLTSATASWCALTPFLTQEGSFISTKSPTSIPSLSTS